MVLKSGTRVLGKWTGAVCQVERALGAGANGEVYLVKTAYGRAAMKVCNRSGDLALEWAHLESLSPSNRVFPKPMLIDDAPPDTYFYVMEWVPGEPLHRVLPSSSPEVFAQITLQVIAALGDLHKTGNAFCDIKPENILVAVKPVLQVRFVDLGGITPFGRSVRQFTPYYDRAFWGLGSRKAEPSYDLCACALCVLFGCIGVPPSSLLQRSPAERKAWLDKTLRKFPHLPFRNLLQDAIEGRAADAGTWQTAWRNPPAVPIASARAQRRRPKPGPMHRGTPKRRAKDWTEWLMWIALGTATTMTLTAWAAFLGWFG